MSLRNGDLLSLLLLLGLCLRLSDYPLWHTDVWGHAKYGQWIRQHHALPEYEPLTPFSDHETSLLHFAWLSQVIYSALYDWGANLAGGDEEQQLRGGAEALRTFHFLMLILRCTIFWLALRRVSQSPNWALLGLFLYVMAVGVGTAIQRPQAFGFLAFSIILYALSGERITWRTLLGLPIVFALWANLHGTWVIGLAALGAWGVGRIVESGWSGESRRVLLLVLLCAGACTIHPHGPAIYYYVVAFSGNPNIKTMDEWRPMRFVPGSGNHWPYLMSLLLLLMLNVLSQRRMGWSAWLLVVPMAAWPWLQERAILWWWTVVMWLVVRVGRGLSDYFPTMPSLPTGEPARWRRWMLAGILLTAGVTIPVVQRSIRGTSTDRVLASGTPWRLAFEMQGRTGYLPDWTEQDRQDLREALNQGAIFASETQGDFLIWQLAPERAVAMFTHAHVFSVEHWTRCLDVKFPEEGRPHRGYLDEWKITIVVVEPETHGDLCADLAADPQWRVIDPGESTNRWIAVRRK